MRLALLANDAAGSPATSAERVAAALRARGAQVEVHDVRAVCAPGGDPAGVVASGPDRVVVAGGDGSVGGAAELAARIDVPLAVVPTGTANDFARSLDLPLDVDRACALAAVRVPRTTTVDVARADGRAFVNAASTGLAVVAARRAHGFKALLGPPAYAFGALRAGATAQPAPVRVSVDGDVVHDGEAWQVIVAGTGAFGGGSELDAADHGDQRLDVAVVPAGPRLALARRAWGMRRGGLTDQDGVVHGRGRVVAVDGPRMFNVDGEVVEVRRPRFAVDGESVRVVVG